MPWKLYEGMAKGVLSPLETASRGPEQPLGVPNSPEKDPYAIQSSILKINSWKSVWKHLDNLQIVWG